MNKNGQIQYQKNKIIIDEVRRMQIPPAIMGQFIELEGEIFITLAKSKIQDDTGNLRNSIGFINRSSRGKYPSTRLIGARVYGGFKGYHAHLLEYGTVKREYKSKFSGKSHYTGSGPAKPFMRPAYDEGRAPFIEGVTKRVEKYIKEMAIKAGIETK
jgi:hypothetical protein